MQNWHLPITAHDQAELTAGLIQAHDKYIQGRDTPAIRVSTPIQEVGNPEPVMTLPMKRFAAISGVLTGSYCLVAVVTKAAAAGAFAGAVTFAGYGLAGAFVVGLVRFVLFVRVDTEDAKSGTTPQNINVTVNVAGSSVNTQTK